MTYLVDMSRHTALEQAAAALYDTRLPYHNFSHVLEALAMARELVERCREADIDVDPGVIYPAILFHDAGYHEDHSRLGYDSKEQYSAVLAGHVLPDYGYGNTQIKAIQQAILSTQCGVPCTTLEGRIVRAADLAGLATSYRLFLQNAMRLWREEIILSGKEVSWEKWRDQAVNTLDQFLAEDLGFSPACYAADGQAWLNKHAAENLARLRTEPAPDTTPAIA